jgi:uncharacterized hydrophobic protein (TIGR00271 family)
MNAIIAMGLGIVQGDAHLLSLGAKTTLAGVAVTIAVSFLLELIIPFNTLTPEMVARSAPNLLDMGVALAAGAAGAYALARKNVSSSLPGVAIAVALIPPLSTAGMALALEEWQVALGAGLLFLTNLVGIVAMSSWMFLSMDFHPEVSRERLRLFARGWQAILLMTFLIAIPLAVVSIRQIKNQRIESSIAAALMIDFENMKDVHLRDWRYTIQDDVVHLELDLEVEHEIPFDQSIIIQKHLAERLARPVALTLKIIPTIRLAPQPPSPTLPIPTPTSTTSATPQVRFKMGALFCVPGRLKSGASGLRPAAGLRRPGRRRAPVGAKRL